MSCEHKCVPYVGVTGIASQEAAETVTKQFKSAGFSGRNINYIGMAGYLVSKTLLDTPQKRLPKYPSIDELPDLIKMTDKGVLSSIHYFTPHPDNLLYEVQDILRFLAKFRDMDIPLGLQVNIKWPRPDALEHIKLKFPNVRLVMQIGPHMIEDFEEDASRFADLRQYAFDVDYVLLDPSGGKGIQTQETILRDTYRAIKKVIPGVTMIIAGGLNSGNVLERVYEFRDLTDGERFGIDAQSGLMSRNNGNATLDLNKTNAYIFTAARVLR